MNKIARLTVLWTVFVTVPMLLAHTGLATAKSIGKDEVNIRSGPSRKSSIVFRAPVGYPIQVEKEEGDWVYFRDWEDDSGWVYKPLVSEIETAVILATTANLRSGAGTKYKKITTAKRGEIYKIMGRNGNWVQLGYYYADEPVGWIRADLVFGD